MPKGAVGEQLIRMRDARVEAFRRRREARNALWVVNGDIVIIQLTRGYVAVIDREDIEKAKPYSWHSHVSKKTNTVYAYATIQGTKPKKSIFLHNVVLEPRQGFVIDHKDGDGLNCRKENLRHATESQNAMNRLRRRQDCLPKGVYRSGPNFEARVTVHRKTIKIGSFPTVDEAVEARNHAASQHYGEFAR